MLGAILKRFGISLPPLPTPPPPHKPARSSLLFLGVLIVIAMAAHFIIGSVYIASFAMAIALLKIFLLYFRRRMPPLYLIVVLTILSFVMVLIFYGGWNGQRAGISFLALLSALKYLESRTLRDYYVVCLILYFLAACSFLFESSIAIIVAVIGFSLAVTAVLIQISNPNPIKLSSTVFGSMLILLKALPLAIVLFFFFPRIQSDFGFFPSHEAKTDSELSDIMVAGDFSSSAFNDALAFRVSFDGDVPPNNQLYWRSKVMPVERNFRWQLDPRTIRRGRNASPNGGTAMLGTGEYHYEILHEKTTDHFLPHLDFVNGYSSGHVLEDYSVFIDKKFPSEFSYRGSSTTKPKRANEITDTQPFLQVRSTPSARVQVLLNKWRSQTQSEHQLAQLVFDYLTENNFRYSLLPPELEDNPIDEFLFETRVGYCEHYASAFTTLMRWLDVPARVVVGYQGGTFNTAGSYLELRYQDAHAWSEILVDGEWHRKDPTATITPDRIEYGMSALLALWDGSEFRTNAGGNALANFLNPSGFNRLFRNISDNWNNLSYQWSKWVVNYDFDMQQELLEQLGLDTGNSLRTLVALVIGGCAILILIYFWHLIPKPVRLGQAQRAYLDFVKKFSRYQITKNLSDTPNQFAVKAVADFPHQQQEIEKITRAYLALRYGRRPGSLNSFKRQVKQFKLTKPKPTSPTP